MLDILAAAACGIIALACFTIHSTSSPDKTVWFNLPRFVRLGLLLVGFTATIRSVNFLSLSHGDAGAPGHANWEGVAAGASMAYLMAAMAFDALRQTYPARVWDRIKAIQYLATCRPRAQPVDRVIFPPEIVAEEMKNANVVLPLATGWNDAATGERVDGGAH